VIIGTPQYLSPEQVEGKKVDQRSDIYSLGVILFEMVTGQVPFDGDTTLSIAVKHKTEIPRDPREFNAQIPEELSQLILMCMEKDPAKRYQTAEALCAELTEIEEEIPTTETTISKKESEIKPLNLSRRLSRFPGILLLFILVLIVGYFFYSQVFRKETPDTSRAGDIKSKNSIIVLPLRDLSSHEDQEPLHILMMEKLIMNLHAFRELRVLPSTTSLSYQDSKKNIQTIGNETNVSYVLGGSLWRTNGMLQVIIQLSSVLSGSLIWTQSFEKPLEDYVDLQEEITKAIAKALGIKDVDERYRIVIAGMPAESITDEYYIRGRHFEILYYGTNDEKDFENSVQNYLKVVEDNPQDAKTYWRLGSICEARYVNESMEEKYLDLMFKYFEKAYEIDPDFAEANMGIGWSYFYKKDNDQAYQFMARAYELDPDNAEINFLIGAFFRSFGLYEQALSFYKRALELDPMPLELELWHDVLIDCYSKLGRFEEAAEHSRKTLEIYPCYSIYMKYAWQLIIQEKFQEAKDQVAEAEKSEPDKSGIRLYRGLIFAAQGHRAKALEQIHDEDVAYTYTITSIYSLLGMKDEAIVNIQLGIDIGFAEWGIYFYSFPFLMSNPFYENLKDVPRFQELLQKEKTKYEKKINRYKDL
jgi:TolB-like protein/Tfp pilus assembly protein PilF